MSAPPTRRQVLVGAAVLSLAACTGRPEDPGADRDAALRLAAVERERRLIGCYDSAIAAQPADTALLQALRAEHAAHLSALDPLAAALSAAPMSAPVDRLRLRAWERATARSHGSAALSAGRVLAGLLAACSASEASHAVALA